MAGTANGTGEESASGAPRAKLVRYAIAAIGPFSTSATQFVLSLAMLRLLAPGPFGSFTFLLVASQLSWGVWSALFCAPLPVLATSGTEREREAGEATLLSANLFGAIVSLPVFAGMALALGLEAGAAAAYAGYGALALVRWFARAHAYVHQRQLRTTASDVAYSATTLAALAPAALTNAMEAQIGCYLALLLGAAAGLVPFGRAFLIRQLRAFRLAHARRYGPIWRAQSRWALLGVVTTEATANAHVYIITLLQGPTAFAPIAASALLLRPVNVAQNALSEFERPQMARQIGARDWGALASAVRTFRLVLAAILLATVALGAAIFALAPRLVFPEAYDLRFLIVASLLWSAVAALRLVQIAESVMLQAAGEFRPLAMASVWSSAVSVAAVVLLVAAAGSLWSIAGLIVGAAVYWYWTHHYANRWLRRTTSASD